MTLLEIKSISVSKKGQITIPSAFRELNMKEDEKAAILVFHDHIEIRPMSALEEKLGCAIASQKALAESWDSPEDDAAWEYLNEELEE